MTWLILKAEHYEIKAEGAWGWGVRLAYHIAEEFVPDFPKSVSPPARTRGRPLKKGPEYYMQLAACLVLWETLALKSGAAKRGAKAHLAREMAKVFHPKPGAPGQKKLARQFQNDLGKLLPAQKDLKIWLTRRLEAGVTREELNEEIERLLTYSQEEIRREVSAVPSAGPHNNSTKK